MMDDDGDSDSDTYTNFFSSCVSIYATLILGPETLCGTWIGAYSIYNVPSYVLGY